MISALGDGYARKVHDREQRLMKLIYTDRKNGLTAEFIHADFGQNDPEKELVWLVLKESR